MRLIALCMGAKDRLTLGGAVVRMVVGPYADSMHPRWWVKNFHRTEPTIAARSIGAAGCSCL
jgi:hypothetical protein